MKIYKRPRHHLRQSVCQIEKIGGRAAFARDFLNLTGRNGLDVNFPFDTYGRVVEEYTYTQDVPATDIKVDRAVYEYDHLNRLTKEEKYGISNTQCTSIQRTDNALINKHWSKTKWEMKCENVESLNRRIIVT